MQTIPAIDLLGEDAVRLEKGDYEKVVVRRPALEYVRALVATAPPMLHVVDLDGARSGSPRPDLLRSVMAAAGGVPVQVSGGIRDVATATELIEAGAARVIIGTAAFGEPALLDDFVRALGEKLVVAVDVRDGHVAVAGWIDQTRIPVDAALERVATAGVVRILGTAISRDGTMAGPDLELMRRLCASQLRVIAAGGVRNQADVDALAQAGCEAAVMGRALYETIAG